ncbi:MAG: response regulator transcription factor [Gemmatimonadota bacterium]
MTAHILVVEDNDDLAAGLVYNLELEGYEVERAARGDEALERARENPPDLLILDLMLPGADGFQVLRTLRAGGMDAPVLILSARGEESDRVQGFRLRADQYVTKPFRLLELLARVESLLARSSRGPEQAPPARIAFGDVVVDTAARVVTRKGEPVSLTPKAYALLLALVRRDGGVATRVELLKEVWGHRGRVLTRTVDSHIAELRRKLEEDSADPQHFLTVWKVGYRFQR